MAFSQIRYESNFWTPHQLHLKLNLTSPRIKKQTLIGSEDRTTVNIAFGSRFVVVYVAAYGFFLLFANLLAECRSIVPPYSIVNNVLTNNSTLVVSKAQTDVGTVVKLQCLYNYTLEAESEFVRCQDNLKWNFTTAPKCGKDEWGIRILTNVEFSGFSD